MSRFQREAEVLASLNHPNIAAIYDLQEAQGSRFLVLEMVDGETLADRIERGPIPVEEALNIARSIAEALEAAHEKGIAHRDLKPDNLFLAKDGRVKILDFGLAKLMQATSGSGGPSVSLYDQTDAGKPPLQPVLHPELRQPVTRMQDQRDNGGAHAIENRGDRL